MSYHGIQFCGIALILYALFAVFASGALRATAELSMASVLVVFIGTILDPLLEKRFARATR